MTRSIFLTLASVTIAVSAPALADDVHIYVDRDRAPIAPNNDSNKWWVDYKTDISEAKRELVSDLRRATDLEDRIDAREEYRREVADERYDYRKEMAERGFRVVSFRENRKSYYALR